MTQNFKNQKPILALVLIFSVFLGAFLYAQYQASISIFLWKKFDIVPQASVIINPATAYEIGSGYLFGKPNYEYDAQKGITYLGRAAILDPTYEGAWFLLGMARFVEGDFTSAMVYFDKEINLYDVSTSENIPYTSYYLKALTYGFTKQFNESAEGFEYLIEINANDSRSWAYYTDLAWVYFQQGRFEDIKNVMEGGEASPVRLKTTGEDGQEIEVLDQGGFSRYPENPWVLNMYALALHNLEETEKAHGLFIQAKTTADLLTNSDWIKAYPGNDPGNAARGLADFREVIEKNIGITSDEYVENIQSQE
ncbi:MAG: tetratricopeptide (TPR) repeat protein [Candidatus Azotimanducaceae bacterium]|jgi:tetratricopeptide (TPR) repeat protein